MVDLRPMKNNYEYTAPFLFKIAGNIESLTLKNIYQHTPDYNHQMFLIGGHYVRDRAAEKDVHPTNIGRIIVDGLYIDERNENGVPENYFRIKSDIGVLSINNVILQRAKGLSEKGSLIKVESGMIGELRLNNITTSGIKTLVDANAENIKSRKAFNVN
jgi:hypothetical protein